MSIQPTIVLMPCCGLLLLLVICCPRISLIWRILSSVVRLCLLCCCLLLLSLPLQIYKTEGVLTLTACLLQYHMGWKSHRQDRWCSRRRGRRSGFAWRSRFCRKWRSWACCGLVYRCRLTSVARAILGVPIGLGLATVVHSAIRRDHYLCLERYSLSTALLSQCGHVPS